MTAEDPKITVIVYKDGRLTGKSEVIDLGKPEEAQKLQDSMVAQEADDQDEF